MAESGDAAAARRTARVHSGWALFWFANIPPVVASYFVLGREAWEASMLLYLAVVSIWANAATHLSNKRAAKAEEASFEHP
jgi:hypothetical protein